MNPRFITLKPKKLIGIRRTMSFAHNTTGELWRAFMPRRKEIANAVPSELISMQIYTDITNPTAMFEKWAAVEVAEVGDVPDGMETHEMAGGLYAVFDYVGSSTDTRIFEEIFGVWLPASEYELDAREHFEVLGEKYKNNDPTSEEEIWVPIKLGFKY